jgi:hypothetical protein
LNLLGLPHRLGRYVIVDRLGASCSYMQQTVVSPSSVTLPSGLPPSAGHAPALGDGGMVTTAEYWVEPWMPSLAHSAGTLTLTPASPLQSELGVNVTVPPAHFTDGVPQVQGLQERRSSNLV